MASLYHRDQAGAPALTYNSTASSAEQFAAFKVILKAALVSGYGSIPAAGWSLVYESTTTLILRPGTNSGYVCFVRESTITVVTVWLAATFAGVDANGKIIGDGVRSGVAANSAVPHRFSVRGLVAYTATTTWAVVADESAFVFSPSAAGSTLQEVTGGLGNAFEAVSLLYCGADSAGDLICVGGLNVASATAGTNLAGFNSSGFTALKFPHTGLLVDTASIAVAMPGSQPNSSSAYTEWPAGAVLPEAALTPLIWVSSGAVRRLKGLAVDSRLLYVYNSQVSQALGGPILTTRNMNNVLSLGDGHKYVVGRSYSATAISALLTTNPEFW